MSNCRVKKYSNLVQSFDLLSNEQKKQFVKHISNDQLKFMCECASNLNEKRVAINDHQVKRLKKYKNKIVTLSGKKSLKEKKKTITGGFASALFSIISTLLPTILSSLKKNGNEH